MPRRRPRHEPRSSILRSVGTNLWKTMIVVLAIAATAIIAAVAWAASGGELAWEQPTTEHVARAVRAASATPAAADGDVQERPVIYLNREGALLTAGDDDSRRNVSSVVQAAGLESYEAAPFVGTALRWNEIRSCIQDRFGDYDVEVVDRRPIEGSYIMVMLGGRPGDLARATGHEGSQVARLRGVAPMGRVPIEDAVVFVFSQSMNDNARVTCETATQEVGHAFGLDHVLDCQDPMTHLASCGRRTFRDRASPCGEHEARTCVSGEPTQNSHRYLLDVIGPAGVEGERTVAARSAPQQPPASRTPQAATHGGN